MARPGAGTSVLDVVIETAGIGWRHFYGKTAHGIGAVTFRLSSEMFDRAALTAIDRGVVLPIASVPDFIVTQPDQIDAFELDHPDGFRLRIERAPQP